MKSFFNGAAGTAPAVAATTTLVFYLIVNVPTTVNCYATRYDHIDVDSILNNRRMVNYYAACLLNTGPCPPQGVEFKRILPEALHTNCQLCTEKQKTVAYRSIKRLKKEYPKIWNELSAKWDPDGAYIRRFEETFENNKTVTPKTTTVSIASVFNRFGDDDEGLNTITTNDKQYPSTTKFTTKSSTTTKTTLKTTPKISPSSSSTTTTTTRTSTTTKKVTTTQSSTNKKVITKRPTLTPLGVNIQATVSYGVNVFNGIVNGLGELGRGVVETGAKLAGAVVSAVVGPPST